MINGSPIFTKSDSTLADGLAVSMVGVNAFATAAPLVDKCVTVSEEYIALAILRLLEMEKAVVEGAGACGFAAVLQGLVPELKGKKVKRLKDKLVSYTIKRTGCLRHERV